MTPSITLEYVLTIARQLAPSDRVRLMARLADDLVPTSLPHAVTPMDDLATLIPVITEGQWNATIPIRRTDLYDADERC